VVVEEGEMKTKREKRNKKQQQQAMGKKASEDVYNRLLDVILLLKCTTSNQLTYCWCFISGMTNAQLRSNLPLFSCFSIRARTRITQLNNRNHI
jgi:hypothetical protein